MKLTGVQPPNYCNGTTARGLPVALALSCSCPPWWSGLVGLKVCHTVRYEQMYWKAPDPNTTFQASRPRSTVQRGHRVPRTSAYQYAPKSGHTNQLQCSGRYGNKWLHSVGVFGANVNRKLLCTVRVLDGVLTSSLLGSSDKTTELSCNCRPG